MFVFLRFIREEAAEYAYEIEKRYIESTDDGLYYKSKDNLT